MTDIISTIVKSAASKEQFESIAKRMAVHAKGMMRICKFSQVLNGYHFERSGSDFVEYMKRQSVEAVGAEASKLASASVSVSETREHEEGGFAGYFGPEPNRKFEAELIVVKREDYEQMMRLASEALRLIHPEPATVRFTDGKPEL